MDIFLPQMAECRHGIMEHIELAGIHSGDSACILPSKHIPVRHVQTIKEYTKKIAKEMNVRGLMNMQLSLIHI